MVAIELDVEYDKKVLREVLIAGDDAKVADIVKAPLFVKPDEQWKLVFYYHGEKMSEEIQQKRETSILKC